VLLAVPPVPDQPWTVASLHRVLLETLDLAKLRAVDAESLGEIGTTCRRCSSAFNANNEVVSTDFAQLRDNAWPDDVQATHRPGDPARWIRAIRRIDRRDRSCRRRLRRRPSAGPARLLRSRADAARSALAARPTCA
jgi:hypothetical protein